MKFLKNAFLQNRNIFPKVQQRERNKWMNDFCFKARKEFDKAKQQFVKFS